MLSAEYRCCLAAYHPPLPRSLISLFCLKADSIQLTYVSAPTSQSSEVTHTYITLMTDTCIHLSAPPPRRRRDIREVFKVYAEEMVGREVRGKERPGT